MACCRICPKLRWVRLVLVIFFNSLHVTTCLFQKLPIKSFHYVDRGSLLIPIRSLVNFFQSSLQVLSLSFTKHISLISAWTFIWHHHTSSSQFNTLIRYDPLHLNPALLFNTITLTLCLHLALQLETIPTPPLILLLHSGLSADQYTSQLLNDIVRSQ